MNDESFAKRSIGELLKTEAELIEKALESYLPKETQNPVALHEAMRYAVFGSGKRLRPLLVLTVCEMLGGSPNEALIPACGIELIHCYSLVHDDLPCLDNDAFRRGRPACHRKFGEALALLAGDALLTLAFQVISKVSGAEKCKRLLSEIALAAGSSGMVGGQALELATEDQDVNPAVLDAIHINKTGQLIKASCLAGAIVADASEPEENRLRRFGEYLGAAFQITDDILDGDGYAKFMSFHKARGKAEEAVLKAKDEMSGFKRNKKLLGISDFVLSRCS